MIHAYCYASMRALETFGTPARAYWLDLERRFYDRLPPAAQRAIQRP